MESLLAGLEAMLVCEQEDGAKSDTADASNAQPKSGRDLRRNASDPERGAPQAQRVSMEQTAAASQEASEFPLDWGSMEADIT
jgi:hypothetical protein